MGTIAGFAMVHPLPPRPGSPDSAARFDAKPAQLDASGLSGAWFETTAGRHALRLYAGGAPRHASDAAVALARCEALLDALDDWLGTTLDWRWIAAPASVTATATHARVHWRPAADPAKGARREAGCRIELPWALLRLLPAPAPALSAQLHWPEVPVVLALAQLAIPHAELAELEPGGAVVLPASMQGNWQGALRSLDDVSREGAGVPVSLASPLTPQRLPMAARVDTVGEAVGERVACEVRLTAPSVVPGDRLAGWYEGDIGAAGGQASLWQCATDREPAVCLAIGDLMPWGDGWALAIGQASEIRQDQR